MTPPCLVNSSLGNFFGFLRFRSGFLGVVGDDDVFVTGIVVVVGVFFFLEVVFVHQFAVEEVELALPLVDGKR